MFPPQNCYSALPHSQTQQVCSVLRILLQCLCKFSKKLHLPSGSITIIPTISSNNTVIQGRTPDAEKECQRAISSNKSNNPKSKVILMSSFKQIWKLIIRHVLSFNDLENHSSSISVAKSNPPAEPQHCVEAAMCMASPGSSAPATGTRADSLLHMICKQKSTDTL